MGRIMVNLMLISRDEFDPLAIVVDWLDACRTGELSALLDLYDERATLECDCERVILAGRKSIAAYWAPKIGSKLVSAFTLDDMTLTGDGVQVDYQSHEGKPVRIQFRFSPSGKILPHQLRPIAIARPASGRYCCKSPFGATNFDRGRTSRRGDLLMQVRQIVPILATPTRLCYSSKRLPAFS
jgi:hypothetical protein